jgi:hypothetical protein
MPDKDIKCKRFSAMLRLSAVPFLTAVLAAQVEVVRDSPSSPSTAPGSSLIQLGIPSGESSWSTTASAANGRPQTSNTVAVAHAGSGDPTGKPAQSDRIRRITLEQVKQQRFVNPATSLLARLSQLSIEAAKQHRLGVQADYFPKLGAMFANLHFSEFLGQVLSVRRPIEHSLVQIPVPLISQNQTIAAITFTQPITPLFMVSQAVRIARADERIAMAKAAISVTKSARDIEIEEAYFRLLIAQRQLTSAELKLRSPDNRPLYAAATIELARASDQEPESMEAKKTTRDRGHQSERTDRLAEPHDGLARGNRTGIGSA